MRITELHPGTEHELVLQAEDERAGYRAIIAIHSTRLGPACGGTRLWRYDSDADALADALRLSRAMSYKAAAAGLAMGGGKSVIIADPGRASREELFQAHGRFVEHLGGRYITAEDVGTSHEDMAIVRRETQHVAGLRDPSPFTARGVFRALQAAAWRRWGTDVLRDRTLALQGCGHIGAALARMLQDAGARLLVADVDDARAQRVARAGIDRVVPAAAITSAPAQAFVPCALGGVLDRATIPRLKCEIVVGAANNQLAEPADADRLAARGILYGPDYVANAGGVIDGARFLFGWTEERNRTTIDAIYDTMLAIFAHADAQGITPAAAADRLAEARLGAVA
jgi:leucine dehydrogenase